MSDATVTSAPSTFSQWGLGVLHGPSQIYFQQNAFTGILVLAAFFVADWRMGVLALIGCVAGMISGRLVGFPLDSVAAGMQSFCGTLVGAAVFAILGGDEWWSYALTLVGGLATGPITWAVNRLFTRTSLKRFTLPYTTAPFVIVAGIIAYSTVNLAVTSPASTITTEPVLAFFASILTNVSQVVLVDNLWAGALILIGLFIASWKVGLAAVLGSVVGTLSALIAGESWAEIGNGLAGYSGVLTAIALSVTFIKSSTLSWLYALPWIIVTAVLTLLMHSIGLYTFTWPYILTTWVALVVAHYIALNRT